MNLKSSNKGYIALMATILISLILLIMVAEEGFTGWHVRFSVLESESKERANALSEGCINQVLIKIIRNPSSHPTTLSSSLGDCAILVDTSQNNPITITASTSINDAKSNEGMAFNMHTVFLGSSPLDPDAGNPSDIQVTPGQAPGLGSWWETSNP